MAYTEPVLVKRIDADPAKRKTHWYDDYVATGGYVQLRKALDMTPEQIIKITIVSAQQAIFAPDKNLGCSAPRGPAAYICGEKTGFLEALEANRGGRRNKPPFPAIAGAFARPTVINNVETLCCIPPILEKGPDWFKSMGTKSSPGPKLFGMSGHVNKPGVYEDELGITLDYAINKLAGGMKGGAHKGTICGGISMGVLGPNQLDVKLDFDDVRFKGGCLE